MMAYNPPFPWFGGKSKVSDIVWRALGDVDNYVEPFFGSGAVLMMRPDGHKRKAETVNDLDHWVANFWRAVQHDPVGVAKWADNPVSEDDLTARHIWLVKHGKPALDERIMANPNYYNVKIAGWWVWGICCWIGSGWCSGNGPWSEEGGQLIHLGDAGRGVNRQRIHLGNAGQGVNRQLIHLGDAGQGVNRQRTELIKYIRSLAARLRYVRICSGDWSRVVTNGALAYGETVGIFLDPPYVDNDRDSNLYNHDTKGDTIPAAVRQWCITNGKNKRYRIALCGYEGEHNELERFGWSVYSWKANRAYGSSNNGGSANNTNRHNERIWFSPACLPVVQPSLFEVTQ